MFKAQELLAVQKPRPRLIPKL